MAEQEKYPVHESVEILDGETVYKTKIWWSAVLKIKIYGRTQYKIYLWHWQNDRWTSKQRLTVTDPETWEKYTAAFQKIREREPSAKPTTPT